jgi:hypothetical protein
LAWGILSWINKVMRLAPRGLLINKKALLRIFALTVLFTGAGLFVFWDYYRVDRDFSELKALLQDTRYRAINKNMTLVVRVVGGEITIMDRKRVRLSTA